MTREKAESIIKSLNGFPGEDRDTVTGHSMAVSLIRRMGLRALSDEAVLRLALDQAQSELAERSEGGHL